jgi:hypothetical protein
LFAAIAQARDGRVAPLLARQLGAPDTELALHASVALEGLGTLAEPALPDLARAAATHWDISTRMLAARTYRAIASKPTPVGPRNCPASVQRDDAPTSAGQWRVTLASGAVHVLGDVEVARSEWSTGSSLAKGHLGGLALRVGEDILVASNAAVTSASSTRVQTPKAVRQPCARRVSALPAQRDS